VTYAIHYKHLDNNHGFHKSNSRHNLNLNGFINHGYEKQANLLNITFSWSMIIHVLVEN